MTERRDYDRLIEDKFDMLERLFVEKMERLHDLQEKTLEQATRTNGRVSKLEGETDTIRFMFRHQWTFWLVFIAGYAMTIQEFRELVFAVVIK